MALWQIYSSIGLFLSYRTDSTDSRTIQRLDLFAWCVRLSPLLIRFRTHLKSMHFSRRTSLALCANLGCCCWYFPDLTWCRLANHPRTTSDLLWHWLIVYRRLQSDDESIYVESSRDGREAKLLTMMIYYAYHLRSRDMHSHTHTAWASLINDFT